MLDGGRRRVISCVFYEIYVYLFVCCGIGLGRIVRVSEVESGKRNRKWLGWGED